jgi:uncharacterized membrane protein
MESFATMKQSDPAWAPVGESAAIILAEKSWLQGAIISSVAYGSAATLFFICFYLLYTQCTTKNRRKHLILMAYTSVIFILGTLFQAAMSEMTQLSFIENRNIDGGPSAYETVMFSIPVDEIGNVAFVIGMWLCDLVIVST